MEGPNINTRNRGDESHSSQAWTDLGGMPGMPRHTVAPSVYMYIYIL